MKIKNYAGTVEDISIGLRNLTGLGFAVYDALFHGTFTAEAYEGAVFILTQEIQRMSDAAEKVVNEMFEDMKNEKK